jgi:hypothetical protein
VDAPGDDTSSRLFANDATIELFATVILALATVVTAWSAFQSTKWGGVQANDYAAAGAARTESSKESTRAGQQTTVDVDVFVQWAAALAQERSADPKASTNAAGEYVPDPTALSGFLYARMRDEFKPAIEAWLATKPLENADAPPTPFAMPQYSLAATRQADRLEARADKFSAQARQANQRGDNYVLLTVLFASVLFFAGVSGKLRSSRNRLLLLGFAVLTLIAGAVVLATFPVEV